MKTTLETALKDREPPKLHWVKRLGQAHIVTDGYKNYCNQPMLGTNYSTSIAARNLKICMTCLSKWAGEQTNEEEK